MIPIPAENIAIRTQGDMSIIDVNGDLDGYAASDLRKELETLVGQKQYQLVVNLAKVNHINSTAVGALVAIAKQVRQHKGDVKICNLADSLKRTFDLIGASKVLEIYASEKEAVGAF